MDKPYPGWKPPDLGRNDECMRLAFACATGINPIKLPFIDPSRKDSRYDFWGRWEKLATKHGYWMRATPVEFDEKHSTNGLWIAIVPTIPALQTECHAVTMKGRELWFDCSDHPRVRRPKKFLDALTLVKNDERD
jgi:hypothetical protein